jgi:hypothetical protein
MIPVMLLLHDYVWLKGINGDRPNPPALVLPPPTIPDEPPTPVCDTLVRVQALDKINSEFSPWGITIDGDAYAAYTSCRHSNLKEVHDDVMNRNDGNHDPSVHPKGVPY